jgi:ABC-type antimicrobial peptide transport system permease subunit
MLSLFAGLALLLAAIGTYGVVSYSVSQRSREFGIRMSMGADRATVVGMVVRQGLLMAGLGILLGLAGAVVGTRLLQGMLFLTAPLDPGVLATVTVVLLMVIILANLVPALRASRTDPVRALRQE